MSSEPEEATEFLMEQNPAERERLAKFWRRFSSPHQRAPVLAQSGAPWTTWLILGGRGAGKTRAGAEWVRSQAADASARIALVGETARDVREVMIEGVSGLLSVHEHGAASGVGAVARPRDLAQRRDRAGLLRRRSR